MDFRSRQQLKRALEPLRQALETHRRSLSLLESALIEFEETLNQLEQRSGGPQVQQVSSSREAIELLRNRGSR
jgi:DNA repair exonuclease SbcCD ATPase subunit